MAKQKRARRITRLALGVLITAVILIGINAAWTNAPWLKDAVNAVLPSGVSVGSANTTENGAPGFAGVTGMAGTSGEGSANTERIGESFSSEANTYKTNNDKAASDTDFLVLINSENRISNEPGPNTLIEAAIYVPTNGIYILLHEEALMAVTEMFDAARAAGQSTLYVSSGYRDYETQKLIYDSTLDKSFVQPPGHSEHHTGLAVDILSVGAEYSADFGTTPAGQWLAKNAHKYGFILRYPESKQDITGISYEPWHFRYVGKDHAKYIYENNLTLEEYILN